MYPFIYTPPEIIAREVKREFSQPKTGNGMVSDKKLKRKLGWSWLVLMTSPIWGSVVLLLLCKVWLGF